MGFNSVFKGLKADNVDDGIVKMEELKVALKRKENYLAKVTWILNIINIQEILLMRDYCF